MIKRAAILLNHGSTFNFQFSIHSVLQAADRITAGLIVVVVGVAADSCGTVVQVAVVREFSAVIGCTPEVYVTTETVVAVGVVAGW